MTKKIIRISQVGPFLWMGINIALVLNVGKSVYKGTWKDYDAFIVGISMGILLLMGYLFLKLIDRFTSNSMQLPAFKQITIGLLLFYIPALPLLFVSENAYWYTVLGMIYAISIGFLLRNVSRFTEVNS